MTRLLSNEKSNSKFKHSKEAKFSTIIGIFGRIVRSNKLLFFSCSLLAFLTAIINYFASFLVDKLIVNDNPISQKIANIQDKRFSFNLNYLFGKREVNSNLRGYISWLITYLVFLKATSSITHWYVTTYSSSKIEKDLKIELFEILTNSSYEKSSEISPKMLTQFSSDIDSIAYNIWTIPNRLIYVVVSITLNLYFNFKREGEFKYALVFVIFMLFSSLFTTIFFLLRKSTKLNIEAKKRYEGDNRFIFERISNLEYIKSVSSEELEKNKLSNRLDDTFKKNQNSLLWTALFRSVPDYLVIPNIPLLFIWIVTLDYFKNQIHSPEVLTIYFLAIRRLNAEVGKIFNSILSLEDLSSDLSIVTGSVNFLAEGESPNYGGFEAFNRGNVIFDKVTFAYPSRAQNNVIEDFSFTFEKDKKYGVAGKNGIGKSTITKILLKLYKVSRGNVLISQKNLSTINTVELHRNVCRLNNRPSFFNMSIAENIFYPFVYNREQNLSKLVYAAKQVRVFSFIKSLPAGFDTVLREGGIDLSEGQKQQLEAMKVFIKGYQIYIFDEILSNVHPSTRKIILGNIFANIRDRLVITIDHHYDVFAYMDYVYKFSSKKLTRIRHPEKLLRNESGEGSF